MTAVVGTSSSNAGVTRRIAPTPVVGGAGTGAGAGAGGGWLQPPASVTMAARTKGLRVMRLHLVIQHDRIPRGRRHGLLDRGPDPLVCGRRDPLLPQFLALELQLEAVVVIGGRRALYDGPPLQHLHADIPLVLDRLGYEA